jgi:hypothetical protein
LDRSRAGAPALRYGNGAARGLVGKFRNRDDQICRTDADTLDPAARPLLVGSRRHREGAVGNRLQARNRCPQFTSALLHTACRQSFFSSHRL